MRTIWKGAISFGLVSIPINLFPATEQKDIKFRYLHKTCQAPIQYKRVCSACGQEVTQENIVRGYEYELGRYVIINEADLEKIPGEQTRSIDIMDFVNLEEIDPIYYDKTYYLAPGEVGEKAYALLWRAMSETAKIAVAKVVIRNKESLAVIRSYRENVLVMETIFYPDEIRNARLLPGLDREVKLRDNELKMARELIENLAAHFEPQKYDDRYRNKLLELIRAKIEGEEVVQVEVAARGKVVDLMEALRASVELAKQAGGKAEKPAKKSLKKWQVNRLLFSAFSPMEPLPRCEPFDDTAYLFQVKWDGVRILAHVGGGQVYLHNRKLNERTRHYPELGLLADLVCGEAVLDGEVVALKDSRPNFPLLLERDLVVPGSAAALVGAARVQISYMVFDIVYRDGKNLMGLPLWERQLILSETVPKDGTVHLVESFEVGTALFESVSERGLEGIVAKRRNSIYLPGKKTLPG